LAPAVAAGPGETAFDAWIRVAHDGVITVSVPQLEMGQGIATLLAQIVAVEIGADWRQVGVSFAPVSELYANAPLAARWAELWMPMAPEGGIAPMAGRRCTGRRTGVSWPPPTACRSRPMRAH
jgi:hypothetical protein